ncbi:Protein of unknown function (DUF1524) [Streptoalloteichus tenebrarius]|uniref:GmrSD restriction endonucleases C-terminal domain-containing protein n=1 Tax=Streptoalloteichus tenebrarius (strain ATCC 17920 / DSM 40477 / JCM 4838 / CBS 697.72 / NBRC 16177 / NCIMB 11028 / NRRL B-12390 / A12253. 1 / ISP 5477) TaxID=1933 RepID=A0ABT1HQD3_STRSD|nr:HNH endonuclease family protein [Streptoalloteichus tenebrarius]MCP2257727.1 Protein of unknown function (DUF1524) [Streptoalloteichus tenebrarius]BFE99919.1 HNH endonuclease family protein [Streptoalloteichus tenebrarius]
MGKKQLQVLLGVVVLVLVVAGALWGAKYGELTEVPSSGAPSAATGSPAVPAVPASGEAAANLDKLKVAPWHAMTGYSREKFKHWVSQGEGCDTRETVLKRDGKDVRTDKECRATSGTWVSVYDGKTVEKAEELDIDHVVPLANAWRTGAADWTDERRSQFANDLKGPQLLAVTASTNRGKGDQDPSQWKPPARSYWCEYATRWITVKHEYGLWVTQEEKAALREMLGTCGTTPSTR